MPANSGRARISDKTDKPRDVKYVLKRLWGYLYHHKRVITSYSIHYTKLYERQPNIFFPALISFWISVVRI